MDTPLEYAHKLARKGLYVFPLNGKRPFRDFLWGQESLATVDPDVIDEYARRFYGCNWAVDCGKSGLVVLDVDHDPENDKDGFADLADLEFSNEPLPETFTVKTPRGGRHLYYLGTTRSRDFTKALETKSVGKYCVAPGGRGPNGKRYEIVNPRQLATAPTWLTDQLGLPIERESIEPDPSVEQDSSVNVERAIQFLQNAEPAVEGQEGDSHTYQIAAQLRELGLSQERALYLMLKHWNERCTPPWEGTELAVKVTNAFKYAMNPPGESAAIESEFPELEDAVEKPQPKNLPVFTGADVRIDDIPRREWLLGSRYLAGFTTLTISRGGIGKSTLVMLEALSVASGIQLTHAPLLERGNVWYYNTEDPADELKRRFLGMCQYHQFDPAAMSNYVLSSGRTAPLRFVADRKVNKSLVDSVCRIIDERRIRLFIIDPFVKTHLCDENDNAQIDLVASVFNSIAERTGCAIGIVHHSRKLGKEGGRGDADTSRGAGALTDAARIAHTLSVMTDGERAKAAKVTETMAPWHLRVDSAKLNLAPPAAGAEWYKRESVTLPNGDSVGTIRRTNVEEMGLVEGAVREDGDEISAVLQKMFKISPDQLVDRDLRDVVEIVRERYGLLQRGKPHERVAALKDRIAVPPLNIPCGDGKHAFDVVWNKKGGRASVWTLVIRDALDPSSA